MCRRLGGAPGTPWKGMENLTPDRPARNESLHWLRYAGSRDGNPAAHPHRHSLLDFARIVKFPAPLQNYLALLHV